MKPPFSEDRLENEKLDPIEQSSLRYTFVPVILISMLVGFGVTYLYFRTQSMDMNSGDARTKPAAVATTAAAGGAPAAPAGEMDLTAFIEKGKNTFTTTCQACHQATGAGIPGAFPPLEGSEWVTGPSSQMAAIVLHGVQGKITVKGQAYQSAMPAFKDVLKDEDIAAVLTYVRQAWGNKASAVKPELVSEVREKTKGRSGAWLGEDELKKEKWE